MLAERFIWPVLVFTKTNPAGEEENVPALAPGGNVGVGLLPDVQKGSLYEKVASGALVMVIVNVALSGHTPSVVKVTV